MEKFSLEGSEDIKRLKHETARTADTIKSRLDDLVSRFDSMSPEKLAFVAKYIDSANHQFDEMAGTEEWQKMLRE